MAERFDAAVVGRPAQVAVVAAGIAGALAGAAPARATLVVSTAARRGGVTVPATRPARRLRERLLARDLQAQAAGRLVWCAVGEEEPAMDARHAAAVGGSVVLAVCGPREPWVEALLDDAGVVLVAGRGEDPLTELALGSLRARGLRAQVVPVPAGLAAVRARGGLDRPADWPTALPLIGGASA